MARSPEVFVSVVHRCPAHGQALMPCCDRTPFEVPRLDRMTLDAALVTCPEGESIPIRYMPEWATTGGVRA